ncbi:MAG: GyrI-like domain-containing protein [Gemmatimonadota bacterium]|nr:MAG: GyrI-like domain-containing protein [Gemmatimonadota bacterium]
MTTNDKIDLFKQLKKAEYAQPKKPVLIDVARGIYLTIDGVGPPGGDEFAAKVGALYAMAYTIKMTRKFDGRQDYVIGKLEGQWWSDRGPDLKNIPQEEWRWKLMIRTPDIVGEGEVQEAAKALLRKGKAPEVEQVRLEAIAEGPCVQMLHVGPYEREWETLSQMLAFAGEQGCEPHGRHHEIYLSDPRRVPPQRLKTILRMPVKEIAEKNPAGP